MNENAKVLLKEIFEASVWRKIAIIKYISMFIIIFAYFNNNIFNVVSNMNITISPIIPFYSFVHLIIILVLDFFLSHLALGLTMRILTSISKLNENKIEAAALAISATLDIIFTIFIFIFSVNFFIYYSLNNNALIDIWPLRISIIYLLILTISSLYNKFLIERYKANIKYTGYVDSNNKQIPFGSKISFKNLVFLVQDGGHHKAVLKKQFSPYDNKAFSSVSDDKNPLYLDTVLEKGDIFLVED